MKVPVTVITPTIAGRNRLLSQAIDSVRQQTVEVTDHFLRHDHDGEGPGPIRQYLVEQARTEWVAFLDDDDMLMPGHVEALYSAALLHEADYVFSWFEVLGGIDPLAVLFGKPWDPAAPTHTTITTLVRRSLVLDTGGFIAEPDSAFADPARRFGEEDWLFTVRANEAGASIFHLPIRSWYWRHHSQNTSGLPRNVGIRRSRR